MDLAFTQEHDVCWGFIIPHAVQTNNFTV